MSAQSSAERDSQVTTLAARPARSVYRVVNPAGENERVIIDLRGAVASDLRERMIPAALEALKRAVQSRRNFEIYWPSGQASAAASAILGMPVAHAVAAVVGNSTCEVTIRTRMGSPEEFLFLAPLRNVMLVFHVSAEEAALRWERGEASPGRRLAAAAKLQAAGWRVMVLATPVQSFPGWKADHAELMERIEALGLDVEERGTKSPRKRLRVALSQTVTSARAVA